jgi:DNA-binding transcriptional MerR regulator
MTAQSLPESPLPPIPNKRYFTIGEVGGLCDVKSHVLRYWEQEFTQLKPAKRRGNRRYYQRHDIELIRLIRSLLYDQGFTIAGARQQLVQAQKNALKGDAPAALEAPREPILDWPALPKDHAFPTPRLDPVLVVRGDEPVVPPRMEPSLESSLEPDFLPRGALLSEEMAQVDSGAEPLAPAPLDATEPLLFSSSVRPLTQVRQALEQILKDLRAQL